MGNFKNQIYTNFFDKIIHAKYTSSTLYRENQSNVRPRFIFAPSAVVDMRRISMTRQIQMSQIISL